MLAAEAYSRDLPRVFMGYDQMLADWRGELARAEAALGAGLPPPTKAVAKAIDQALSADLRHNDGMADLSPYGWAGRLAQQVWTWFADAAAGGSPPPNGLAEAAAELERRRQDVGVLISPLTRDLDAARAELLDLRHAISSTRKELQMLDAQRHALGVEVAALRDERAQAMAMIDYFLARS
jgi:hypothetical protein